METLFQEATPDFAYQYVEFHRTVVSYSSTLNGKAYYECYNTWLVDNGGESICIRFPRYIIEQDGSALSNCVTFESIQISGTRPPVVAE